MKNINNIELHGQALLGNPRYNKGSAFTRPERETFKLIGLLPPRVETIDEQVIRVYEQYSSQAGDLAKNLFLNELFAVNTTLFYRLASTNLSEMLPIVYTPTIGDAVEEYSRNFMRPQGLIIALDDQDRIDDIFAAIDPNELDIAVVTDGEGVLGIGDQGIGGLNISIGKLMVYTLCGGINPYRTLPIQLDVGTNNEKLLADPFYLGLRHPRVTGERYLLFIDKFVAAFRNRFPRSFLHWEDFGKGNARQVLDRYRDVHQSFNDDIQGTGAVTLAAVLAGIKKSQIASDEHRFCIFGAGTAGGGIADQISQALALTENKDLSEIRQRFYLIDSKGLLTSRTSNLLPFQAHYARPADELNNWQVENAEHIRLAEVIKNARPTVLIGCSAQTGAFSDDLLAEMSSYCEHPIIMPLSNPTSKAETTPDRILAATQGKALIATGSPFGSAEWRGQKIAIAQCNNALVFPGIGLGMLISQAQQLTDSMLLAASTALSDLEERESDKNTLLPGFANILQISRAVALAVAQTAMREGTAEQMTATELETAITSHTWTPEY
ncbi:MAG: NAD-dependent malic enzyme [Candidatus Riflebacteria bacterium]|nr:NAD-dependent malic enzyme [Candidatus Riflebacteria bacterium]